MITEYRVKLRHDKGAATVTVFGHSTARSAVRALLDSEHAPQRAVLTVRARPVCEYCDLPATRYDSASGDETPLCVAHAHEHYPAGSGGVRANTGSLGPLRFVVVAPDEWREDNA